MKVALIPCATTEWREEGRLLGRVEIPVSVAGQQKCGGWVAGLAAAGLQRIYHAPDELATQTASLLADQLGVPVKPLDELAEVDVGLWAGLTDEQLRARFASAHRELREAPLNVVPPAGEGLSDAAARLENCVRKVIRRNGNTAIGIVTRPLGLALLKCALAGGEFSELWEQARGADEPVILDCG